MSPTLRDEKLTPFPCTDFTIQVETTQTYDVIYRAYLEDLQRAIIVDNHKLVHYPKLNRYKLFDLKNDPMEMNNLIGDEQQIYRVRSLKEAMRRQQRQMDDPLAIEHQ